ncbi:MAG: DUF4405 domain-containing protein [Bacteroidales bacterium]|nr:DUF4405 domain-containing protein [Bacteroidales bacterium]MCF8391379.1 DUF4405 domain-containing protein [Bacteroidales bacterium]
MKNKFSWKAFVSIGLFYSFFIIFLTGLALYIAPPGRVAHWEEWTFLGFTKENWESIHVIFSFSFVILSVFHLFFLNWRIFWFYIKKKAVSGVNKKREFYVSTLLVIIFFAATYFSLPPFGSIMTLSTNIKESWEDTNSQPPVPHAELLNLEELAEVVNSLSLDQIIKIFEENSIKFDSIQQTMQEIAELNNTSPAGLYSILKLPKVEAKGQGGGGSGTGGGGGTGIGRKTIETIAFETNQDTDSLLMILKENGFEASENQTLRDIAEEYDVPAMDIYDLIKIQK